MPRIKSRIVTFSALGPTEVLEFRRHPFLGSGSRLLLNDVIAIVAVGANLIADLLYAVVNPLIRYKQCARQRPLAQD